MRRFQIMCGLLAVAVTFSAVATATAQEEKKNRQRGRSSGRAFRGFGSVNKLTLVSRSEKVQKELKLDEEATKQVKSLAEEFSAKRRESRGSFTGLRDLSDDEREKAIAKLVESSRKLSAEYGKKVDAVLGKEKSARLSQIALWATHQRGGISAVVRNDALAKTIKLTGEQKEKLTAINEESGRKRSELRRDRDTPREERTKKRAEITEQANKQVKELLTEDQTAAIKKAMGEKFEVDLSALGRGGQPRRRRPGN